MARLRFNEVGMNGYHPHHDDDDDDDDDELIIDDGNRTVHKKGFCYRYSQLLARYPLLVFIALLLITAAMGVTSYVLYDLPDFGDATKGFESRGTELTARRYTIRRVSKDERLIPLPNITKYLDNLGRYTNDVQDWIDGAPEYNIPGGPPEPEVPADEPEVPAEKPEVPADEPEVFDSSSYSSADYELTLSPAYTETPSELHTDTASNASALQPEPGKIIPHPPEPGKTVPQQPGFCRFAQGEWKDQSRVVFTPVKGHTLFTADAMHSMCRLQQRILSSFATTEDRAFMKTPFDENQQCHRTWSILNLIMISNNKTSCEDISGEDLQRFKGLLQDCVTFYEIGVLNDSCEEPSNCQVEVPEKCLRNYIVKTIFHDLTPNSFVKEVKEETFNLKSTMMFLDVNRWTDRWDFYIEVFDKKVVSDGITTISAMEFGVKFDLFNDYLESDALYLALGTGLAIMIIVFYTRSLFITIMTIVNIGMSVAIAYFVYRVIFQFAFTPFVNILAVVLLIGIGADDTFVFIDIWNKAKSDLPNKDRTEIMHETLRHAAITMFVTSFTTGSALYANIISSIVAIKCFAVFSGTAIMANFILTITWLPVVVVIDDWCEEKCCGWRRLVLDYAGCCWRPLSKAFDAFFQSYLPLLIFKLRYLWIVILFLLGSGGACLVLYWPKLQLPTATDFQVFYSEHPLERYDLKFKNHYDFEQDQINVLSYIAVFGVVAIDDRSRWDPDGRGESDGIQLDEKFDVSEPNSQDWLLTFCADLRKQPFIDQRKNDTHCFIEIIKKHMEEPCSSASSFIPDECCGRNHTDFPYTKSTFQFCAPIVCYIFQDCSGQTGYPFRIQHGPLFSGENNTIAAFSIVATSTYDDGPDYEVMHEFVTSANSWTSEKVRNASAGISEGWFITQGFYQLGFYALQDGLATGAAESMGISLVIAAFVLFVTTRNILISLYAIASVSGTVFVTIGTLVLLGWQLNIIESVILSIAVGLSVDFTIHYGVAYRIAPAADRKGRSEFALQTLGSAITVAALSTFSAGAMMMPASVLSYSQLGLFMMLVMSISWVFAHFFFLSLCRTIGPPRNIGQIGLPRCMQCCTNKYPGAEALDIHFYIEEDSTTTTRRDSNHTPNSDNGLEQVEMDTPNTMQFNSLVLEL